jgi:uncharacterized protein (DUF983 family)
MKICPNCHARALAPFLGPKRRCKACGSYVDVLDLLTMEFPASPGALPAEPPAR